MRDVEKVRLWARQARGFRGLDISNTRQAACLAYGAYLRGLISHHRVWTMPMPSKGERRKWERRLAPDAREAISTWKATLRAEQ